MNSKNDSIPHAHRSQENGYHYKLYSIPSGIIAEYTLDRAELPAKKFLCTESSKRCSLATA